MSLIIEKISYKKNTNFVKLALIKGNRGSIEFIETKANILF
jgi:hypothetical protein